MGSMAGAERATAAIACVGQHNQRGGSNPILGGVYLKSDWHSIKNPFRFEVQG